MWDGDGGAHAGLRCELSLVQSMVQTKAETKSISVVNVSVRFYPVQLSHLMPPRPSPRRLLESNGLIFGVEK